MGYTAQEDRVHEQSVSIYAESYNTLLKDFQGAALSGKDIEIPAPSWLKPGAFPISKIVFDDLSEDNGREMLAIIAACARGEDATLRASVWIRRNAEAYAAENVDDMARGILRDMDC